MVSNHSRLPGFGALGPIASAEDLPALIAPPAGKSRDDLEIEHRAERERRRAYDRDSDRAGADVDGGAYREDEEGDMMQRRDMAGSPLFRSVPSSSTGRVHFSQPQPPLTSTFTSTSAAYGYPPPLNDPESQHRPYIVASSASSPSSSSSSLAYSTALLDPETNSDPITYEGPFQPPDSQELIGILASVSAVCVLALAAGMTTIYDWVL